MSDRNALLSIGHFSFYRKLISECPQCSAGVSLHLVEFLEPADESGPRIFALHDGNDFKGLDWYKVKFKEILPE